LNPYEEKKAFCWAGAILEDGPHQRLCSSRIIVVIIVARIKIQHTDAERGKILQAFSLRADSSLEAVSPVPPSANETFNAASAAPFPPSYQNEQPLFVKTLRRVLVCIVLDSLQSAAAAAGFSLCFLSKVSARRLLIVPALSISPKPHPQKEQLVKFRNHFSCQTFVISLSLTAQTE
jgi:hypothetical protein